MDVSVSLNGTKHEIMLWQRIILYYGKMNEAMSTHDEQWFNKLNNGFKKAIHDFFFK